MSALSERHAYIRSQLAKLGHSAAQIDAAFASGQNMNDYYASVRDTGSPPANTSSLSPEIIQQMIDLGLDPATIQANIASAAVDPAIQQQIIDSVNASITRGLTGGGNQTLDQLSGGTQQTGTQAQAGGAPAGSLGTITSDVNPGNTVVTGTGGLPGFIPPASVGALFSDPGFSTIDDSASTIGNDAIEINDTASGIIISETPVGNTPHGETGDLSLPSDADTPFLGGIRDIFGPNAENPIGGIDLLALPNILDNAGASLPTLPTGNPNTNVSGDPPPLVINPPVSTTGGGVTNEPYDVDIDVITGLPIGTPVNNGSNPGSLPALNTSPDFESNTVTPPVVEPPPEVIGVATTGENPMAPPTETPSTNNNNEPPPLIIPTIPGTTDPGGPNVPITDIISDAVGSVWNNITNDFDLGGILEGGINIYGQQEAAEAAAEGAKDLWNLANDELEPYNTMGQGQIGAAEAGVFQPPTEDLNSLVNPLNPTIWGLGGAGDAPTAWGGYEGLGGLEENTALNFSGDSTGGLKDLMAQTGGWEQFAQENLIQRGGDQWNLLENDARVRAQNIGAARGRLNTQESRDSALKSMLRAGGEMENINQSRLNQELSRRSSDWGISSGERSQLFGENFAQGNRDFGESLSSGEFQTNQAIVNRDSQIKEQLSEATTKFDQQRERRNDLWAQIFGKSQAEKGNALAMNAQTFNQGLVERQQQASEQQQMMNQIMSMIGIGENAGAHSGNNVVSAGQGLPGMQGNATANLYSGLGEMLGQAFGGGSSSGTSGNEWIDQIMLGGGT